MTGEGSFCEELVDSLDLLAGQRPLSGHAIFAPGLEINLVPYVTVNGQGTWHFVGENIFELPQQVKVWTAFHGVPILSSKPFLFI
jgi:hypothetical protein